MLDRKVAPSFKKIEKISLPEAEENRLDNGLPLYFIHAGKQPVTRLELIFHAGSWFEKSIGESYFAAKLLAEGTSSKNAAAISNEVDKYGAFLDLHASMDYVILTLECLSKYLNQLLPLLHELIYDSVFPEEEYRILKNIKTQQIRVNNEKNNVLASKKLREVLFGADHPYGKELTVSAIEQLTLQDIENFYKAHLLGPFDLVLSGDPEPDSIEAINNIFGKEALQGEKPSLPIQANGASAEEVVIEKESSVQSSIRLGKRLFKKDHPDLIDVLVLNELLGGYFGSRLMKNIREDKGYTYGISSGVVTLKNEGYFVIGTDVKKENTAQTIHEIHKEIRLLQAELVPEEELNAVRNFMTGSFLSEINTPFALADKFKAVHLNDLDYSYYTRYIHRINTISAQEIREIANKYLPVDSFSNVVVGGLS